MAVLVLALLLLLLLWRNVIIRVYGQDDAGQKQLLKTIRRLKRRKDEVVVPLKSRHVRGGIGGTVELGRAFTRRMRDRRLIVTVTA